MTQSDTKTLATAAEPLMVPADLTASDARDLRKDVLASMTSQEASQLIELGSETPEASVSALQLLIAATRPTGAAPATLGPRAQAAVSALTETRGWEEPSS